MAAVVQLRAFAIEDTDRHVRLRVDGVQASGYLVVDGVAGGGGNVAAVAVIAQLFGESPIDAPLAFQLVRSDHAHFYLVALGLEILQARRPRPIAHSYVENEVLSFGYDGFAQLVRPLAGIGMRAAWPCVVRRWGGTCAVRRGR